MNNTASSKHRVGLADQNSAIGSGNADSHGSAPSGLGLRQRAIRSVGRAVLVAAAVAAGMATIHPATTFAAVSDGFGYGDETVFCNSVTHTVTITTRSAGIPTTQTAGSDFQPYFLNGRVWLRLQEFVDGAWRAPTSWMLLTDGVHVVPWSERAGATSYWSFTWAFETRSGTIDYGTEWAGGFKPYGYYSDQRGFKTLTSCRS